MKVPSGELLLWAVVLLGGAAYIATTLPATAPEFQVVSGAVVVCLAAVGVLLLVRFRWSPEMFAAVFVFGLGWGVVRGLAGGFTGSRVAIAGGAAAALFGYPALRRAVRGQAGNLRPPLTAATRLPGGETAMGRDLQAVDDYLAKWDRFAQGENRLVSFLRENQETFEATLARLLHAKDKRAPARMVFYPVVQVGGSIPTDSGLGRAAAEILGPEFPVCSEEGECGYFAGDLFFWWQDNSKHYEAYPLFEEWSNRDFAQTVAIPMYKSCCERE